MPFLKLGNANMSLTFSAQTNIILPLSFQLDKLRLIKERDDQLDNQSARYEDRLVELHSVIAELSRQLEQRAQERIPEEQDDVADDDDDDTRDDDDDEDVTTPMSENCDMEASIRIAEMSSRTSTDILDAQAVEASLKK